MESDFSKKEAHLVKNWYSQQTPFFKDNMMLKISKLFRIPFHLDITSKLSSIKNFFQVYSNGFSLLKVYFFGGKTYAFLTDFKGNKLCFNVSKKNIKKVISLGKLLVKFQDTYTLEDNKINFELWPNVSKNLDYSFDSSDLQDLHLLKKFERKYVSDGECFDHEKYLITDIDGLRWILRKNSLTCDLKFGSLLANYTEPKEHKWFLKALNFKGVFVDVGANVGGYSIRACKMGVETIAIEPDPDNFHVISLNVKHNHLANTHLLRLAVGDKKEVRDLYYNENYSTVSYCLDQNKTTLEAKCKVQVMPLDLALAPLLGDKQINLLKIDTEGFEIEVLKGASNCLKRTRYIILEVLPGTKAKLQKVLNLLKPLGFELIDKLCMVPIGSNIAEYTLFFRNSKIE